MIETENLASCHQKLSYRQQKKGIFFIKMEDYFAALSICFGFTEINMNE